MVNKIIGYVLLGVFIIFFCIGLYYLCGNKMYVGGDAYNFIINACRAASCFVVAFGSLISSILLGVFSNFESNEAQN